MRPALCRAPCDWLKTPSRMTADLGRDLRLICMDIAAAGRGLNDRVADGIEPLWRWSPPIAG